MLSKRLIACLDVRDGKLAKSVRFVDTKDIGDPVEKAREYYADGLDELVFYDITASSDKRNIMLDVVEKVAEQVFIPLSVGGGVRSVADATDLRLAGAEKINVNSAAVQRPELISECAEAIGDQNIVLSMDIRRVERCDEFPSGYEIVINGGRTPMGIDALDWARKGEKLGAGELVINSIDADGTREGYELTLTAMLAEAVHSVADTGNQALLIWGSRAARRAPTPEHHRHSGGREGVRRGNLQKGEEESGQEARLREQQGLGVREKAGV